MALALRLFFGWWGRELASLVPPRLRALLNRQRDLVLHLGQTEIVITYHGDGHIREVARIPLVATETRQPVALTGVPSDARQVLLLQPHQALRRMLQLPVAAERDLRQVVSFELERQSPIRPDQACYTAATRRRLPDRQRIEVAVTIVPRPVVEAALRTAHSLGFAPSIIDVEGEGQPEAARNLLPEAAPPSSRRLAVPALAASASVLLFAAIYLPLHREEQLLAQLRADLTATEAGAKQVMKIREGATRTAAAYALLDRRKQECQSLTDLVNRMAKLLPDGTWLTQFQASPTAAHLSGFSQSASGLVRVLESSDILRSPTFESPVLQDRDAGAERFQIAVQLARTCP